MIYFVGGIWLASYLWVLYLEWQATEGTFRYVHPERYQGKPPHPVVRILGLALFAPVLVPIWYACQFSEFVYYLVMGRRK